LSLYFTNIQRVPARGDDAASWTDYLALTDADNLLDRRLFCAYKNIPTTADLKLAKRRGK
jgi:hypothetical protein